MEKSKVVLSAVQRATLERMTSIGKQPARKLIRGRILLLADISQGNALTDEQIARELRTSLSTIARVRKTFQAEGLRAAVNRRPQPARPQKKKIKGAVKQMLFDLVRSEPRRDRGDWNPKLLAGELVSRGVLDRVSQETIRQALNSKEPRRSPGGDAEASLEVTPVGACCNRLSARDDRDP